jgi:hypothetical protein
MRRSALMKLALGVGVLMVAILALTACGGGGGGGEPQAKAEGQAKARPLPQDPQALRPGEYHSTEFEPSFSFRVGKGWRTSSEFLQISDKLAIVRGEEEPPPTLIFRAPQELFKYAKNGTTPEVATPEAVKAPKDMAGWFQHHPYLKTEKPEPATVGGVKGVRFDYTVSGDAPYDYINLFRYTDGSDGGAGKGFKYRAIVLEDVEGKTVTIGIGSPTTGFDDLLPEAQKVLDTVKWEGP